MTNIESIREILNASVEPSKINQVRFYKVNTGGYAENDKFIGVSVPILRKIAKRFSKINLDEVIVLIKSAINEERLLALLILADIYKKGSYEDKKKIYEFYIENLNYVNNWNLVDSSAHLIVGNYLLDKDKQFLLELAKSDVMWNRRVGIVATWGFIKAGQVEWTFKISEVLMQDKHDLIHKATGWMLREAGQKDLSSLKNFLEKHSHYMPRTMLRYAIEKFSQSEREYYMNMKNRLSK